VSLFLGAFSLVELILVVAMLGAVLGISLPRLKEHADALALQVMARRIFLLLDYAKTSAVLQNNKVEVLIDMENSNIFLKRLKEQQRASRLIRVPSDMFVVGETRNIVFYPDGTTQEFNFSLRARNGKAVIFSGNGFDGRISVSN